MQVRGLNSLTIFLLWVYLEVQALGETPWRSTKLCMNKHGIIVFSNKKANKRLILDQIIVDFTSDRSITRLWWYPQTPLREI